MLCSLLILSGAGLVWVRGAGAQSTNATCLLQYSWMTNMRGQSPCLVAAYAQGACTSDGQWAVRDIPDPTLHYVGPNADQATLCTCSSVSFSLISACSICQGASVPRWSEWTENCPRTQITNGSYPNDIPSGTTFPAWAYEVINSTDLWDPVAAQELIAAGYPESTPAGFQTTVFQTATASDTQTFTSSPASSSATPTPTSVPKKDIGPIVGGAVGGGVGGLILLGLGAFFCWKYFWKRYPPSAPTIVSSEGYGKYLGTPSPQPTQLNSPPMRLYNPDDPTTFPSHHIPPVSPTNGSQPHPGAPFMTPHQNYSGDLVPNRASYA